MPLLTPDRDECRAGSGRAEVTNEAELEAKTLRIAGYTAPHSHKGQERCACTAYFSAGARRISVSKCMGFRARELLA